jgi:glycerol-3-phosphate acyltransferase PlsY
MDYFMVFLGLLTSYLLGSIPTSVWVGKWFYGKDVRDEGSGNAGATNTLRVLGLRAGIPVVIIDILKGYAGVWVMQFFLPADWSNEVKVYLEIVAGLVAVMGHTLPIFAGFRGGKGVATLYGAGVALYGWAMIIPLLIWLLVIALTRYVSLGSMLAGMSFPFLVVFVFHIFHPGLVALSIIAALFIVWTHRKNIVRLLKGEESKIVFKKTKDKS